MSDPAGLLVRLAARHERKLMAPKNLAKGSWVHMTDSDIKRRIVDEVHELLEAIVLGYPWEDIADEAADVMHFAEMGADPDRRF